ncbi:MAG: radical SAM protein [Treponema sp.]|nr:radical SAM protein [Treponema sp.]
MSPYKNCRLCPRRCGVDREAGNRGYCGETAELRLAFAGIHKGEEPPVSGRGGSGTIFVSGCNLGCAFCQNYQISQGEHTSGRTVSRGNNGCRGIGRAVETGEFADICLALREKGAENINIVTGSHAAPALALGIEAARKRGLCIPVLWNSSGYDGEETLAILRDFVDVYLPDLKTLDSELAERFFNAPDYPEHAALAILKMMEFGELRFNAGIMVKGVMVRHLVIPGCLDATRQVLAWFSRHCRGKALLSLMTQYTPVQTGGQGKNRTAIPGRYVSEGEYEAVLSMLDEFGIDDGFCQELVTGSEWLPDFTRANPFSSKLSIPVWHWC